MSKACSNIHGQDIKEKNHVVHIQTWLSPPVDADGKEQDRCHETFPLR